MKKNLPIFFIFLFVFVALTLAIFYYGGFSAFRAPLVQSEVTINGHVFKVGIADTFASRAQGLSGRDGLQENEGIFFVFPTSSSSYGFWMKDMKFALDLVWINGDTIVGITENVRPEPGVSVFKLKSYYPPAPVDKVLEVSAGLAEKLGLKVGDTVRVTP